MQNTLPTILIIENNRAILELYCRELGRYFHVLSCSRKGEALPTIQTHPVCAIVLEPAAWNGQGWNLLDSIMALPAEVGSFPIILCSVLDERKRGLDKGVSAFLVKPVLPSQLLKTLHQLVKDEENK